MSGSSIMAAPISLIMTNDAGNINKKMQVKNIQVSVDTLIVTIIIYNLIAKKNYKTLDF